MFYLLFLAFPLFSQYSIKGKVVDSETGEPLPFVNIVFNNQGHGVTTSLDGFFEISSSNKINVLKTSYVGYMPKQVEVLPRHFSKLMLIALTPTSYNLDEVIVYPGINPAHPIIEKVYENRQRNNPERLAEFKYNSYNKMYFTAERDTIVINANGEELNQPKMVADTAEFKVDKMLKKHHLLMMESVTERIYMHPNRSHEAVLASRVSGFNDPLLAFLATQYQSFSFYPELLNVGGKYHLNPISKNSTKRYLFILEDTIFSSSVDTVFVISFRPLRNTNFAGLQGVMNINSNGYAIQSVIAQPVEPPSPAFNIKIQQRYQLVDSVQWFPVELNTTLYIKNGEMQVADSASKRKISYMVVGRGSTYIKNINLTPELKARNFSHIEVSFDPSAMVRPDDFWRGYRIEPLTEQEQRTYQFVDSLSREVNLNRMMRLIDAMVLGKIPAGIFNVDINKLLDYNRFEGYRVGLGLETNQRVLRWATLGGHYGYGFHDKQHKYGAFLRLAISPLHQLELEGRYENDVREPGEVVFERQSGMLNADLFRTFMIDKMDYTERFSMSLRFRLLKRIKLGFSATQTNFTVASGYGFEHSSLSSPLSYQTNEVGIHFKYAKREPHIQTLRGFLPLGFEYPVAWVNYYRGVKYDGKGFEYNRFEARLDHRVNFRVLGKTSITLTAGLIEGDIPTSLLYFTPGSMDRLPFDATNSFGTIKPFEFVSDRYAYAYLRHNFGQVFGKFKFQQFKPELTLVQNVGFGSYTHSSTHNFGDLVPLDMSKVFFESGILVNGILANSFYSLGVGVYYRWGHYAYPRFEDNFALKLTMATNF